ncbi:MAG: aminotransferase class V-fold PLP-dependent enzyme [Planctomycetota bacterium]
MSLDPDPATMRRLGADASARVADHLDRLRSQRVFTPPRRPELEAVVTEPLPTTGAGLDDCLRRFFDDLLPHATLVNHPRFFGWVPGPGSFAGALGAFAASAANLFVGTWLGGAVAAQLELQVVDWLRQALGLPTGVGGVLTSGGSLANLAALAAARARARALRRRGFRVYVGAEAHDSLRKAARVLGIPPEDVVAIDADADQRIDLDALRRAVDADLARGLDPGAITVTMGTTSTGAVDGIASCADLAAGRGAWLHVDGAYGAASAVLPERDDLRVMLQRADSITIDPHKGLYAPFECGCLLLRDLDALRSAFTGDAPYLQDIPRDEVNFFERGPELSRGARAVPLWFVLRGLGLDAIRDAIRRDAAHARLAHDLLAADPRVIIVTPPRMSVFSFALAAGEAATQELLRCIHADGFAMLSSSRVAGRFVLRFCAVNHRTTREDVEATVAHVRARIAAAGG